MNIGENAFDIILTSSGSRIIIDAGRHDILGRIWHVDGTGYASANNWSNGRNLIIRMHRMVVGEIVGGLVVDHINRNKLDNRRCNLRVCTQAENARNRLEQANNTSGRRGVYWAKERGRWAAQIKVNGRQIGLGRFSSYADAVRTRAEAESRIFGAFAPCLDAQGISETDEGDDE